MTTSKKEEAGEAGEYEVANIDINHLKQLPHTHMASTRHVPHTERKLCEEPEERARQSNNHFDHYEDCTAFIIITSDYK